MSTTTKYSFAFGLLIAGVVAALPFRKTNSSDATPEVAMSSAEPEDADAEALDAGLEREDGGSTAPSSARVDRLCRKRLLTKLVLLTRLKGRLAIGRFHASQDSQGVALFVPYTYTF